MLCVLVSGVGKTDNDRAGPVGNSKTGDPLTAGPFGFGSCAEDVGDFDCGCGRVGS